MRVSPYGASEYHDGNEVGRYGRDHVAKERVFVWYHSGIGNKALWGMDTDIEYRISPSVDTILVADPNNGLHAIPRDVLTDQQRTLDGREQYVISSEHEAVMHLGDPDDHLQGHLWVTADNGHGGYHKDKNEA